MLKPVIKGRWRGVEDAADALNRWQGCKGKEEALKYDHEALNDVGKASKEDVE